MIKKAKEKNYYMNNTDFERYIAEFYEKLESDKNAKIPDTLGTIILKLCTRFGTRYNFRNYTYNDEMIDDAILACILAIRRKKFTLGYGKKAFSYFNKIIENSFLQRRKKEKKERTIRDNLILIENSFEPDDDGGVHIDQLLGDNFSFTSY